MFCCTKGFPMSFWIRCSVVLHRIWLYKNMKKETKSVYTVQFVRKSFIIFEDIFHVSYYEKLAGKIMFLLLCNSFEYLNYILLYLIQKIYTIHFFRLRFFFCIVFLGIIIRKQSWCNFHPLREKPVSTMTSSTSYIYKW